MKINEGDSLKHSQLIDMIVRLTDALDGVENFTDEMRELVDEANELIAKES